MKFFPNSKSSLIGKGGRYVFPPVDFKEQASGITLRYWLHFHTKVLTPLSHFIQGVKAPVRSVISPVRGVITPNV